MKPLKPAAAEEPQTRPWVVRALPFLAAGPALTRAQWRLLGVVGAANLFDNYALALFGLALPQIQLGLGVAEEDIGGVGAILRLGVIPALIFTVLADHMGRRGLLLVTVLGFTLTTFLTGFAQNANQFMAMQFLARMFIAAESMLAVVVIAEEFTAETRGWGIGLLGAMGTLGHGLAALMFALVNYLPFGWRALYVLGALPILIVAWLRRSLSETRRFEDHRQQRGASSGLVAILQPVRNLLRMYPGRMLALCAAFLPAAFVVETAMTFVSKTLQQEHGYSPASVAALFLTVGVVAPLGNVAAGLMGDRFGRKPVIVIGFIVNAAMIALFYNTSGIWVPPVWGVMLATLTMLLALFQALGSELFPTSYRSTASGIRQLVATIGAALGLWAEAAIYEVVGSHGTAITWMLIVTPIAPIIAALFLPETANLELEEIAPEKE